MNPILLFITFWIDSPNSNVLFHGKPLLERTPIAYAYFWSSTFLPGNPPTFEVAVSAAFISNTLLYSGLSYLIMSRLGKQQV